jgi:acetyl-CoA carboxylase carboxyltransferase component
MAGRAYEPRFLFMYPNSKISVMGGEQAANVLITVKEDQLKAAGKSLSPEDREKMLQTTLKKYEEEGSAYFSTARLWDDGIIDPADTRKILGLAIAISQNKKYEKTQYGIFRM